MTEDTSVEFEILDASELTEDAVVLRYIPVEQAVLWQDNPKLHDIGALIVSIEDHGFRDPPAWDAQLGAIVEGNGRITALQMMEQQGRPTPRGVLTDNKGRWCMPVLFGIDARSQFDAKRYGIDHNDLTMMGGDFTARDIARMWDTDMYIQTLDDIAMHSKMPVSMDYSDLQGLKESRFNKTDEISEDMYGDNKTPDSLLDEHEHDDQSDRQRPDRNSGAVLVIKVANFNLVEDVYDAIRDMLDANPGWDAAISRN